MKKELSLDEIIEIESELQEYKGILKDNDVTGIEMSKKLGILYSSYRSSTKTSADCVPKWVTAFLIGYKLNNSET
jgi:hypothetical protein